MILFTGKIECACQMYYFIIFILLYSSVIKKTIFYSTSKLFLAAKASAFRTYRIQIFNRGDAHTQENNVDYDDS